MVERGEGGVIINVASGTALRGNRHFAYPTAKGGTISLTKSAATILGLQNIRVNVIIPGTVQKGRRLTRTKRPIENGGAVWCRSGDWANGGSLVHCACFWPRMPLSILRGRALLSMEVGWPPASDPPG